MSNVLLWFPRVALQDCTIEGELLNLLLRYQYNYAHYGLLNYRRASLVFLAFYDYVTNHTGYDIKKGWHVNIDATYIHHDSDLYNDPLKFNPKRFDVVSFLSTYFGFLSLDCFLPRPCVKKLLFVSYLQEHQKPYSFIPFGSGPRTCLGINMAKVTMLVFLHRLAGGYT